MPKFPPPASFTFSRPTEWPEWRRRFERYRIATKLDKDEGVVQVNALIYAMGPEADHIFKTFTFASADDANKFDKVIELYEAHFIPRRNITYERAQFYQRTQKDGETIETFVRTLYDLAEHCTFGALKSEQIKDRIVIGVQNSTLSQKLQLQTDLTLEKAIELAKQYELVQTQNAHSQAQPTAELSSVAAAPHHQSGSGGRGWFQSRWRGSYRGGRGGQQRGQNTGQQQQRGGQQQASQGQSSAAAQSNPDCGNCGYNHNPGRDNCPARNSECRTCRRTGHYARKCRSGQAVQEVTVNEPTYFLGAVQDDGEEAWRETLDIQGGSIDFKLDSGADVSIISEKAWEDLRPRVKLNDVTAKLMSPGGPLNCKGQFIARNVSKGKIYNFRVIVTREATDSLLSREMATKMGFIKRVEDVRTELFAELGLVDCEPVKIVLRDDAEPYSVSTARRVPIPLESAVKAELQRMETLGIVERVSEPTPWCSPMVPVVKPSGKLRICVDLKRLNASVAREKHTLPILDDVLHRLAGSTVFSKLDASSGFWQIPLDPDSAKHIHHTLRPLLFPAPSFWDHQCS